MRFQIKLSLENTRQNVIPINYQYPLSAAIYKILQKGDAEYAQFLHEEGYGKGYKFFTFSDLKLKFRLENGDRMRVLGEQVEFLAHFHIPEASKTFIEGLFKSENIVIADKKSKAVFNVQSIQSLPSPFDSSVLKNAIIQMFFKPVSAVLVGVKNDRDNYDYLKPDDDNYIDSLIYNWRGKIGEAYDEKTAEQAVLLAEVELFDNPYRSRLVHIKSETDAETKIRGYLNFKLKLTAEKRFLELIYNTGIGLENAQGMGCLEVWE